MTNKLVISSGHSLKVRGAADLIDEVKEARRVTDRVHAILNEGGVQAIKFHDNTSSSQGVNLDTIVSNHNRHERKLDVSVHFNASSRTLAARGVEVLHYNLKTKEAAARVSYAISKASGLKNRGAKVRTNLAFLRNTNKPAILLEICFVDSVADVKAYNDNFEAICQAIAKELAALVGSSLRNTTQLAKELPSSLYLVTTGTFETGAQARAAIEKMKALGILKVAHLLNKGGAYYIRTGTYNTKAEAERALQEMKQNKIVWQGEVNAA